MNKTKMTLAVIGGVIGLLVLVMAYFTWDAFSAKTAAMEGDDENVGLEAVVNKTQTLSRKPVYPCAESLVAIESNRALIAGWQTEAVKLAAGGDRVFERTTPPAFKNFMVSEAKRLSALPGRVNGVLVKSDFAFGPFKDYITGGSIPTEAQLTELQRKWDDVTMLTETLAGCGVAELTDVQFAAAVTEEKKDDRNDRSRNAKKSGKNAKQQSEPTIAPCAYTYVFSFAAKPPAFIKVLNALETCKRFVSVDKFSFTRPQDIIATALGGGDKKPEAAASAGRRGRRGRAVVEEKKENEDDNKSGIITDPLLDDPLSVVMTVTVCDFRSLEEKVEEKTEEVQK